MNAKQIFSIAILSGIGGIGFLGVNTSVAQDTSADSIKAINYATQQLAEGNVEEALQAYNTAAETDADNHTLSYNRGIALYRNGDIEAARAQFLNALNSADSTLAAKSWFNLGNCDYSKAVAVAEENRPAAIESLTSSIQKYRRSLKLNSDDTDARANIELAAKLIAQLQQEEEQQQKQDEQQQDQQQDQQQINRINKAKINSNLSYGENSEQQDQSQQNQNQAGENSSENQQSENQAGDQNQQNENQSQNDSQESQGDESKQDSSQQDSGDQSQQGEQSETGKEGENQQDQAEENQPNEDSTDAQSEQKSEENAQHNQSDASNENGDQKGEQQNQSSQQSAQEQKEDLQEQAEQLQQQADAGEQAEPNEPNADQGQQGASSGQPVQQPKVGEAGTAGAPTYGNSQAGSAEGEMDKHEAMKMLQSIRDRDLLRRYQKLQETQRRHIPEIGSGQRSGLVVDYQKTLGHESLTDMARGARVFKQAVFQPLAFLGAYCEVRGPGVPDQRALLPQIGAIAQIAMGLSR